MMFGIGKALDRHDEAVKKADDIAKQNDMAAMRNAIIVYNAHQSRIKARDEGYIVPDFFTLSHEEQSYYYYNNGAPFAPPQQQLQVDSVAAVDAPVVNAEIITGEAENNGNSEEMEVVDDSAVASSGEDNNNNSDVSEENCNDNSVQEEGCDDNNADEENCNDKSVQEEENAGGDADEENGDDKSEEEEPETNTGVGGGVRNDKSVREKELETNTGVGGARIEEISDTGAAPVTAKEKKELYMTIFRQIVGDRRPRFENIMELKKRFFPRLLNPLYSEDGIMVFKRRDVVGFAHLLSDDNKIKNKYDGIVKTHPHILEVDKIFRIKQEGE